MEQDRFDGLNHSIQKKHWGWVLEEVD